MFTADRVRWTHTYTETQHCWVTVSQGWLWWTIDTHLHSESQFPIMFPLESAALQWFLRTSKHSPVVLARCVLSAGGSMRERGRVQTEKSESMGNVNWKRDQILLFIFLLLPSYGWKHSGQHSRWLRRHSSVAHRGSTQPFWSTLVSVSHTDTVCTLKGCHYSLTDVPLYLSSSSLAEGVYQA